MLIPDPLSIILVALVFVPLERLFALRREQQIFRKLWQLDVVYLLVNGALIGFGINLLLFGALMLTAQIVPKEFQSWVGTQPFWVQLPVLLILADLGFYAVHRMFHKIRGFGNSTQCITVLRDGLACGPSRAPHRPDLYQGGFTPAGFRLGFFRMARCRLCRDLSLAVAVHSFQCEYQHRPIGPDYCFAALPPLAPR